MLPLNSISDRESEKSSWLVVTIVSIATSSLKLIMRLYSLKFLHSGRIRYSSLQLLRIHFAFLTPSDFQSMVAPLSFDA